MIGLKVSRMRNMKLVIGLKILIRRRRNMRLVIGLKVSGIRRRRAVRLVIHI